MRVFHKIKDPDLSKFWTILVISNPIRYVSRYDLLNRMCYQFQNHNLLIVEMAFGDRPYEVTEHGNPRHLRLRSFDELWHKENMINLGIQHLNTLDPNWEYVAWVDADVIFQRPDILAETWHELQHHMVVQMFQTAVDLLPWGTADKIYRSFCWNYVRGVQDVDSEGYGYGYVGHPGFCWAARREAIEAMGQLIDFAILGAGDHHMALGLIGRMKASYPGNISESYKRLLSAWEKRVLTHIKKDIGFVHGSILHMWHGKKKHRRYKERWEILTSNQFDPLEDIKRDSQGLYILNDNKTKLRDDIRAYFRQRNEDSIDEV